MQAELTAISAQLAGAENPEAAPRHERLLGALCGRLLCKGGWTATSRHAGGEPLWTGRERPYDPSTMRRWANTMAQQGGTNIVAQHLHAQVERAVAASDGSKVTAFTDMFDQPFFTKKPAHAGPIGRLGNRILGASYWGLTFVRLPNGGPSLAYHVSGHKPASPLHDALKDLYSDPRCSAWLRKNIRVHNWDRGGNGKAVLEWAIGCGIPYLTLANKSVLWRRFHGAVRATDQGVPVHDRLDRPLLAAADASPHGLVPTHIIFPAHPEKGRGCPKALQYRTAAELTQAELLNMDQLYKQRWPSMENQIKAAISSGFGANLDRKQVLTTSRGEDGKLASLQAREAALNLEIAKLPPPTTKAAKRRLDSRRRKLRSVRGRRVALQRKPLTKHARVLTNAEPLCKNLMVLVLNALALVLGTSAIPAIQKMGPHLLRELLLGRNALACIGANDVTLHVEPVHDARQRELQVQVLELFTRQNLQLHGRALKLRVQNGSTIQRFQN